MRINSTNPKNEIFGKIGAVVRTGGIILYPTDTVYGLGCDPFNTGALERIYRLKGRVPDKGVLLLVSSEEWLPRITGDISPVMLELCRSWWPGPVTCLFKAGPDLPLLLTGSGGKIGVRIPESRFLLSLMGSIPGPIVSTSANLAGEPPSSRFSEINRDIINGVDLYLEDSEDSTVDGKASTVIDLSGSEPLVIREGAGMEKVRASGILD